MFQKPARLCRSNAFTKATHNRIEKRMLGTLHISSLQQSGTQSLASDWRMLLYLFLAPSASLRCRTLTEDKGSQCMNEYSKEQNLLGKILNLQLA